MMMPLRLTSFEEYMLVDDQPAYPMSCFFMIKLRGRFDVSLFESALQHTLAQHPLLTCSVTETKGQYYWSYADKKSEIIRWGSSNGERRFPASPGIDLQREPALKITLSTAKTDSAKVILDGQTNIIFELHHSASDAAGITRFIEDVLCRYAHQAGAAVVPRESVNPDLLSQRGFFGPPQNRMMQVLPKQSWGLLRAWTFLFHRVIPLTSKKPKNAAMPTADFPAILHKDLTAVETQNVLHKAKQLGITVNDLYLCAAFFAMQHWREHHAEKDTNRNLRIAVPINLRTTEDALMPAANIVSMVFLDRKPRHIHPTKTFYQAVHREMQHIKRCNLGWTFIFGLNLYKRIFCSFRKMTQQNRCWSTATVTNLGKLFTEVPLARREGYIQITDSLELIGVETAPPIRSGTALGISTMTYAERMTINLHYDSSVLTRSDAESILNNIVGEITG